MSRRWRTWWICKLPSWVLKVCPNIQWLLTKTGRFSGFRHVKVSVCNHQLITKPTEQRFPWSCDKKYKLYRISSGSPKQIATTARNSNNSVSWGKGRIWFPELPCYIIWNVWCTQKYETCKETRKYDPYTGTKESIETVPEESQTLNLSDKVSKLFLNMFKDLRQPYLKN